MNTLHSISARFARTLLFLGALAFLANGAPAANAPAPPSPAVRFTAFVWDDIGAEGTLTLNYSVKGKTHPLDLVWRDRSPAQPCDGAGPLQFTRTVERDGKKIEQPAALATIPAGLSRALLIFGRNPSSAPGQPAWLVRVIDDSRERFPGRSVRLINFSRRPLGGSVGERSFEVRPGGDQVVPAALPEPNRLLPFRLARLDDQGGWRKLRSTALPMTEDARVLIFLMDSPEDPARVEMVMLRDQVPAAAPVSPEDLRVNPQTN